MAKDTMNSSSIEPRDRLRSAVSKPASLIGTLIENASVEAATVIIRGKTAIANQKLQRFRK